MALLTAIAVQWSAFKKLLPVIQMNAYLGTWLALGIFLYQLFVSIMSAKLPKTLVYAKWLPVAYLVWRFTHGLFFKNYLPDINKLTTVVYNENGKDPGKPAANGIVCFVVGSQQNQ